MNLIEQDLPWLTAEARNDPVTAQQIIEALAERVQTLQQQADELRAENVLLKRSGSHQVYQEQVQRLRTDLHDLRTFAERKGLNQDVVSVVAFTGQGVHIAAPAPMDRTLTLETSPEEPVRDLKPLFLASMTRLDSLLVLTSSFRLALIAGLNLPLSENMNWRDARSIGALALQRSERVEAMCAVNELNPPRMIVIVTRRGWVRPMSWALVENLAISGQPITPPNNADSPAWIGGCDEGHLLLLTRNGRWTRFPITSIDASGSAGVTLDADDDVACAAAIQNADAAMYFIGADGAQIAVANNGLEAHKKPGAKPLALTRRFISLACFAARKTDAVLLLSNNGDLIVETLRALPVAARPSEAQPLNVVNQRLIAATLLK
jgi:DNA gyrase/topoisomerase IV subunit A